MQQKLQTRAFERVAPVLEPGEQTVVAARANVGKFKSGRLGALVRNTLVAEGGGLVGAALASTSKQFIVVTDRRLIFLPQGFFGGPGRKVLGEMPLDRVSVAETKMGIMSLVRIAFGDEGDGIALTFPRVDRKNAEALATALGAPVA